jgi:hypothetical protein
VGAEGGSLRDVGSELREGRCLRKGGRGGGGKKWGGVGWGKVCVYYMTMLERQSKSYTDSES